MYVSIAFVITLMLNVSYCHSNISLEKYHSKFVGVLNSYQLRSGYERPVYEYTRRVKWLCFNSSHSEFFDCCTIRHIYCLESGPALPFGHCATYSENGTTKSLSTSKCPYQQWNNYNVTTPWFVSLPVSLTELNDYMCGPLNRKDLVCSECADGYGPSFTSNGYKCVNCTNAWYRIPLFLLVQFVSSTFLYIIILVFRVSVVSPPMPCIIMCLQFFVLGFDMTLFTRSSKSYYYHELLFTEDGHIRLDVKIIRIIYSFFNQLDIFRYVLPPICLNSKIKQIHLYFLSYISVFYPILLIILTWVCVNLHDNNIRPFVWLWRPFHKCFVHLRRKWDIKSDLVDAFITFFLLSYVRSACHAVVLLAGFISIHTVDQSGGVHSKYHLLIDLSIDYFGRAHLPFAVTAIFLFSIFNILPALLLILYPLGAFHSCMSKCRLDFIAVNTFADKIQCYYRNGIDGGKDMRCFSGLYLLLWTGLSSITIGIVIVTFHYHRVWFCIGVSFQIMAIILAIVKPYRKMYMNYTDALLLLCIALQFFSMSSGMLRISRILICIPVFVSFVMITIKVLKKCLFPVKAPLKKCYSLCPLKISRMEHYTESIHSDTSETQPLIYPTSEISY